MLQESIISYQFRSELNRRILRFQGDSISVGEIKERVEADRMSKLTRAEQQN